MELLNETAFPARLLRSTLVDETRMLGVAVAKATYRIGPSGDLTPDTADPVPITREPLATPSGELPGDMVPLKRGADVHVLGKACAPGLRPVTESSVSVQIGAWSCRLAVFGDRRWERRGDAFCIGDPEPFTEIPITWERAYGGAARVRGGEVPDAYNPAGKGFLLDASQVEGAPLPNLEDPDDLVRAWDQRPVPLAFAPTPLASRFSADDMLAEDPATGEITLARVSFNRAHPKMRVGALAAGDRVTVTGMSAGAPIAFTLPALTLGAHVWIADRSYVFPLRADTLCVLAEERRVYLVHRCRFTYSFIPEEIRLCRIREVAP